MRYHRFVIVLLCFVMLLELMSPNAISHRAEPVLNSLSSSSADTNPSAPFNYVVVIVMENQGICDVDGSLNCATHDTAPNMTSLANSAGLAENYTAITHPSLSNYLGLLSGQDWGCAGLLDPPPNSDLCTMTAWNSANANLVDRLEASGFTWKAYMENMPSDCMIQNSDLYASRHNPFVYFNDIVDNPARCANVVPSGTNDTALLNDLASTNTAPNFMWLTPNVCNDMHDDCTSNSTSRTMCEGGGNNNNTNNCIHQGDTYLSQLVPKILNSTIFTTRKAALFLTFDEGNGYCPMNQNRMADCIYSVWAGPTVKKHYVSKNPYSHYSFLSTLEAAWILQPLTSNDATAPPMSEFFTTVFPPQFKSSPSSPEVGQTAQFNTTTGGGIGPYSFTWNLGDNSIATGNTTSHTYGLAGPYLVTVNATDSLGNSTTYAETIIVTLRSTLTTFTCPRNGIAGIAMSCQVSVSDIGPGLRSVPVGKVILSTGGSCVLAGGSCSLSTLVSSTGLWIVTASYASSDTSHAGSTASQWFAIRMTPSEVIDQPTDLCISSLCYTQALWAWILLGTILTVASAIVVKSGSRFRKRHSQLKQN